MRQKDKRTESEKALYSLMKTIVTQFSTVRTEVTEGSGRAAFYTVCTPVLWIGGLGMDGWKRVAVGFMELKLSVKM